MAPDRPLTELNENERAALCVAIVDYREERVTEEHRCALFMGIGIGAGSIINVGGTPTDEDIQEYCTAAEAQCGSVGAAEDIAGNFGVADSCSIATGVNATCQATVAEYVACEEAWMSKLAERAETFVCEPDKSLPDRGPESEACLQFKQRCPVVFPSR